jgi:hypothetical protein
MSHCSRLKAVCPEQPNGYHCALFAEVRTCNTLLFLSSHGCYSPTAPADPSLRPLISSGSLMRCKPFQCTNPVFSRWGEKLPKVAGAPTPTSLQLLSCWHPFPLQRRTNFPIEAVSPLLQPNKGIGCLLLDLLVDGLPQCPVGCLSHPWI